MSDSVDIMCARPRASRQASTPRDSCGLDFNMLFDEGVASSSEELRRSHREPCTYMYLRLLRRLCTSENIRMRKVSFTPETQHYTSDRGPNQQSDHRVRPRRLFCLIKYRFRTY